MPSHRIAPSPTSRGLAAPGSQRPSSPCPGGPIWPPALAPAWPPGGLSRVAASRLAVPRPASLQRHPAGPNRHPARQPGRAPAPLRTSRGSRTEPCAAAAAAAPLCPLPDPRAVPSPLPGPRQGSAHARPAALTSRERTDSTPSARREPNRCPRARYRRRRRRLYRRRRCCTRVLVRRRRLPTDQPSSPVTAAQACYLSPSALHPRTAQAHRTSPSSTLPPTYPSNDAYA